MAEICLDCLNKLNEAEDSKWRYVLSWERDFCEECGQYMRVVITERLWSRAQRALTELCERSKRKGL